MTYDAFTLVKDKTIKLLDGNGSVTLVDVGPRVCPDGYTPEFAIVRAARISFGLGLKTPIEDERLIRYLISNKHSSPMEMCNVTLLVKAPLPIMTQFLRHRTFKFNMFSQRYSEVDEDLGRYDPTKYEHGIRIQSTVNKQGSDKTDNVKEIKECMDTMNLHLEQIDEMYHKLIDLGCAKEIARFWLPQCTYSTMYMQCDLNNLIKMLHLRDDPHAQLEIQVYAKAMIELCRPLFPVIFDVYDDMKNGIHLTGREIKAFVNDIPLETNSVSERKAYEEKKKKLKSE